MKKEEVEIYSDTSNYAVMKHPGREYPGTLIQGDALYSLWQIAKEISDLVKKENYAEAQEEIDELNSLLLERLNHYKKVLKEHKIELPFSE